MADAIPYTPVAALQIPQPPHSRTPALAVVTAFDRLLGALGALLRVEEAFAAQAATGAALHLDLDATSHGYAEVEALAQAVLWAPSVGRADRALQTGALLVRMAIGMEAPQDREGICQMIGETRTVLMLEAGPGAADVSEARAVNLRLALAFRRLERLVELGAESGMSLEDAVEDDGLIPVY